MAQRIYTVTSANFPRNWCIFCTGFNLSCKGRLLSLLSNKLVNYKLHMNHNYGALIANWSNLNITIKYLNFVHEVSVKTQLFLPGLPYFYYTLDIRFGYMLPIRTLLPHLQVNFGPVIVKWRVMNSALDIETGFIQDSILPHTLISCNDGVCWLWSWTQSWTFNACTSGECHSLCTPWYTVQSEQSEWNWLCW